MRPASVQPFVPVTRLAAVQSHLPVCRPSLRGERPMNRLIAEAVQARLTEEAAAEATRARQAAVSAAAAARAPAFGRADAPQAAGPAVVQHRDQHRSVVLSPQPATGPAITRSLRRDRHCC